MRLTALGVYGPFPRAGSACSGYVVETGETRILLDCGSGVFSRLSGVCQLDSIDAVVLSHLHFDHCSDMGVLRYAAEAGWCGEAPLRVIAPETPAEIRDPLLDSPAFALEPAEDGKQIRIGDLTVMLHRMRPRSRPMAPRSRIQQASACFTRAIPAGSRNWKPWYTASISFLPTHALQMLKRRSARTST